MADRLGNSPFPFHEYYLHPKSFLFLTSTNWKFWFLFSGFLQRMLFVSHNDYINNFNSVSGLFNGTAHSPLQLLYVCTKFWSLYMIFGIITSVSAYHISSSSSQPDSQHMRRQLFIKWAWDIIVRFGLTFSYRIIPLLPHIKRAGFIISSEPDVYVKRACLMISSEPDLFIYMLLSWYGRST